MFYLVLMATAMFIHFPYVGLSENGVPQIFHGFMVIFHIQTAKWGRRNNVRTSATNLSTAAWEPRNSSWNRLP